MKKKNKLTENIKYLENISNSLEQSINVLKQISETINENKEELKKTIQKLFTNLRNAINEREDELIISVDKKFNELFFNEEYFIKEGEKLPKLLKKTLETGNKMNLAALVRYDIDYTLFVLFSSKSRKDNCQWDKSKLKIYINDCIDIENNINEIKKIEQIIKKSNSMKLKINFFSEEKEINNILKSIKELGKVFNKLFDSNIEIDEKLIEKWLNNKSFNSKLLFRKTRDGSKPEDFHNKCDKKGITITFIETIKGYRFGVYTELEWDCKGKKKDDSTFLFSFNHKQKYDIKENFGCIGCNGAHDLWFGSSFPEIYFDKTLDKGRSFDSSNNSTFKIKRVLTNGEEFWDVKEIEVFEITYI